MGQGAYILGCAGPVLDPGEARFFRDADPFGFILFARNVDSPDQLRALTVALRDAVGRQAPVLIDQEGGRVERMGPPRWRHWLPPLDQVARAGPENAARSMYLRSRLIARDLTEVGIDVNCAPLGDLARADTHAVLRNRCYGGAPGPVTGIARAVADGLIDGGVLPVLKHVPGHGRARVDSHADLPVVDVDLEMLEVEDFAPFRALSDLPMAMTAHQVVTALDPHAAVTVSAPAIAYLRGALGIGGLLMTDDISMRALGGTIAERAGAAVAAGCDLVLHCNGVRDEMEAVAATLGRMTPAARARADAALARRGAPGAIDIAAAEAELGRMMKGDIHA